MHKRKYISRKSSVAMSKCMVQIRYPFVRQNYETDAGIDLKCSCDGIIFPAETIKVHIAQRYCIQAGFKGTVHPRSSVAQKGLLVHSTVIDALYSGDIFIIVTNTGDEPFYFKECDRLAQLIITKVVPVEFIVSTIFDENLDEKVRGKNGFGSTGI